MALENITNQWSCLLQIEDDSISHDGRITADCENASVWKQWNVNGSGSIALKGDVVQLSGLGETLDEEGKQRVCVLWSIWVCVVDRKEAERVA